MKKDFSDHSLYLVDGTAAIFRSYHALPPMSNSAGEPTAAIYGVVNMLRSFSKNYRPSHLVFILDAPGPTFRHRLAPDYKANRPPAPPDLRSQIDGVKEVLVAAGVPLIVAHSGLEADDVIASLARRAVADGGEAVVVSNDKDLMQLVGGGISMIDPNKNVRLDSAGVIAKMGVPPELVGDYLALVGDQADNIRGVAKCGPKTAVRWLGQYGSLSALIEHADEIGGVVGENLRATVEQLPATRELVALREDVEFEQAPADLRLRPSDRGRLEELLAHYEFRTWLAQTRGGASLLTLPQEGVGAPAPMPSRSGDRYVCLDTETSGSSMAKGHRVIEIGCVEIVGRSLGGREFHSYFNPNCDIERGAYRVHGLSREFLADKPDFADRYDDFSDFISGSILLIHNARFDTGFLDGELQRIGKPRLAELCDDIRDTLDMARSRHVRMQNSLDALCKRYGIDSSGREKRHSALVDAQLLARVYLAMTGRQHSLPEEVGGAAAPLASSGAEPVSVILTEADWQSWNAELKAAESFALWILADVANPRSAVLVGLAWAIAGKAAYLPLRHGSEGAKKKQLSANRIFAGLKSLLESGARRAVGLAWAIAGKTAYLPLGHRAEGAKKPLSAARIFADLRPLLESGAHLVVGHDLKQQWGLLAEVGIDLNAVADDLMLLSYVFEGGRHDFASIARRHLGRELSNLEDLVGSGKKAIPLAETGIDKAAAFAAGRAAAALAMRAHLAPRVQGLEGLRRIYGDIELPLIRVLARMERNGILIDVGLLDGLSREMAEEAAQVQQRAHEIAGMEFNLASPGQVGELLYGKLGLPVLRKTPKGQPSTSEEVLEELADEHELPGLVLRHRSVEKLRGTYTEKLPREIDARTGRVHSSFQQAVASTGRLSSTDPNLQNIPIRGERGKRIRSAFIAPEGQMLVAADYSQIELRIVAHMSADATLLQAFAEGQDVHSRTAAEIMGVPLAEVTTEQRRIGKEINFAIIYGMSAFGLSRRLKIGRGEAEHYISTYFDRYPGVRAYRDGAIDRAREHGYAETLYGRRIYLPEINARQTPRRRHAERVSVNAPVQGTAADVIKMAMIAVDRRLDAEGMPAHLLLQVHDELVFEVAENAVDQLLEMLPPSMSGVVELEVPLQVDVGAGASWGALKD